MVHLFSDWEDFFLELMSWDFKAKIFIPLLFKQNIEVKAFKTELFCIEFKNEELFCIQKMCTYYFYITYLRMYYLLLKSKTEKEIS